MFGGLNRSFKVESHHEKVGRAVPSAPREVAKTRTFRTSWNGRGVLGDSAPCHRTAWPTRPSAGVILWFESEKEHQDIGIDRAIRHWLQKNQDLWAADQDDAEAPPTSPPPP